MGHQSEAGLAGDVFEGAVAAVAKEDVAAARAGDEQVLASVVFIIGPRGAHADAVAEADAGLLRHILEGAVALVAIEDVTAQLVAEVNVVLAVAVEVADRDAAAVVVEVDLELRALLAGQEVHPPGDPRGLSFLAETGEIVPTGLFVVVAPEKEGRTEGKRDQHDGAEQGLRGNE